MPLTLSKTPLENWIKEKIGLEPQKELNRKAITDYQVIRLRKVLEYVQKFSPFYRQHFAEWSTFELDDLMDLADLPLTSTEDLRKDPLAFLCVSQDNVSRVVTLPYQEYPEKPKRIFFTEADLELTVDFFHHGMTTLVNPGQRVLILLPGSQPDSVGDLLVRGLARMNVDGYIHGPVQNAEETIQAILDLQIDCLVGIPVQVIGLVHHPNATLIPKGRLKSLLLSTDYIPQAVVTEIKRVWDCPVYPHYGTTEMGYGGGVACSAMKGYHFREADLYLEIIDPESGKPVPPGQPGEIVFTTLTREAMPLIRYRTGDYSVFITELCPCGSLICRLGQIRSGREKSIIYKSPVQLSTPDLDELIFAIPGVLNYQAELREKQGRDLLRLIIVTKGRDKASLLQEVQKTVSRLSLVQEAIIQGLLEIEVDCRSHDEWFTTGVAKHGILDRRGE